MIEIKSLLGFENMTKDVPGTWRYVILVCSGSVIVQTRKKEVHVSGQFNFEWELGITYVRGPEEGSGEFPEEGVRLSITSLNFQDNMPHAKRKQLLDVLSYYFVQSVRDMHLGGHILQDELLCKMKEGMMGKTKWRAKVYAVEQSGDLVAHEVGEEDREDRISRHDLAAVQAAGGEEGALFDVLTKGGRTVHLKAASPEQRDLWVRTLKSGMEEEGGDWVGKGKDPERADFKRKLSLQEISASGIRKEGGGGGGGGGGGQSEAEDNLKPRKKVMYHSKSFSRLRGNTLSSAVCFSPTASSAP